ncbi:MAG: phosphodiester glycosidase family protein [Lachnospiraceae bacterium]|nr:phosphodiester glycosidase family protein [Lachnospiraceae bacterium]
MKIKSAGVFAITYGLLLAGLAVYVLLDSFVIPHRYAYAKEENAAAAENTETAETDEAVGEQTQNVSEASGAAAKRGSGKSTKGRGKNRTGGETESGDGEDKLQEEDSEDVNTDTVNEYHGDGVDITLKQYRVNDTDVYVADVKLESADSLRTALAEDTYGRNVTEQPSVMADNNDAILAINGDFYGSRQSGYVIRGGILYRDKAQRGNEDLVILKNGEFLIIKEDEVSAGELLDMGAWDVFSFGPALITDGEIAVEEGEEVGKAMQSNPRTAIGVIDELHYVFLVADGRTADNTGLTLRELADFMKKLGVETAYNLDGGGSSAMVFKGELVNKPTTGGRKIGERSVSDIVYIR